MINIKFAESLRPWALLLAMTFLILLINIDYTAVNIALVDISKELDANLNTLQWLLSGYVLAWAAGVVPAGQLADIYGKRRMLLLGIFIFTLSSLWCGVATSEHMMIIARIFQGLGGALFVPPLYTLTFSSFPPEKQGFAIGMLGAGAGIGLAIGPTFGGTLLELLNWRWIFYVNVPLCFSTILIAMMSTEKESSVVSEHRFDFIGSFLLGASLVAIMYGINQMEVWGVLSASVWSFIGAGVVLLLAFWVSSRNKENALIPAGLFKNVPFLGCTIGFMIFELIFSVIIVTVNLYMQNVIGYTAYESGILFLAMTLAVGFLSPVGGKMTDRMDARVPACLGMGLVAIGTSMLIATGISTPLAYLLSALLFIGLGLGIALPSFNAAMMKTVDAKILSTASGVFVMFAGLGNTLGVVASTSLLVGLGEPYLATIIHRSGQEFSSTQLEAIHEVFGSAYRDLNLLNGMDVSSLTQWMNEAFVDANSWIMISITIICMIAFVVSLKTIKIPKA